MGIEGDMKGAATIAHSWLVKLDAATSSSDVEATTSLFLNNGWLRDVLVFTWTHRSLCGHGAIAAFLSSHLRQAQIRNIKLDEDHGISPSVITTSGHAMVEAALTFDTPIVHGRGLTRLLQDQGGEWKALSVFLVVDDLKGHEEKDFESGLYDGHTKTWNEVQEVRRARVEKDPHVLIGEYLNIYSPLGSSAIGSRCCTDWVERRGAFPTNGDPHSVDRSIEHGR
jgi:hypothetical protein